jgi:hypothetical protein
LVINVNITIRGLDEAVFRRFKAKAIEEGMRLGEAVTQAMEIWIKRRRAKGRASLLEMEPLDWGAGTERLSIEIDRVLYGGRG